MILTLYLYLYSPATATLTDAMEKAAIYLNKYPRSSAQAIRSVQATRHNDDDSLDFDEDDIDISLSSSDEAKPSLSKDKRAGKRSSSRGGGGASGGPAIMSLRELDEEVKEEGAVGWQSSMSMGDTLKGKLSSSAVGVVKGASDLGTIMASASAASTAAALAAVEGEGEIQSQGEEERATINQPRVPASQAARFLTIDDLSSILVATSPRHVSASLGLPPFTSPLDTPPVPDGSVIM